MTLTAAPRATGSAAWADALLLSFAQAGYAQAEPAILQPAEPFLDLSGEDIRKSLYLTTDAGGEELCLRPDLTIPVARDYLASSRPASRPASAISGRCSAIAAAGRANSCRPASNPSDGRIAPRPTPRCWRWRCRRRAAFGVDEVEIRTGDVALFIAADRCARPLSGVAAAADQGFQPQDQPGAGSRAADACDRTQPQRI